jgi:hypothetical protein
MVSGYKNISILFEFIHYHCRYGTGSISSLRFIPDEASIIRSDAFPSSIVCDPLQGYCFQQLPHCIRANNLKLLSRLIEDYWHVSDLPFTDTVNV